MWSSTNTRKTPSCTKILGSRKTWESCETCVTSIWCLPWYRQWVKCSLSEHSRKMTQLCSVVSEWVDILEPVALESRSLSSSQCFSLCGEVRLIYLLLMSQTLRWNAILFSVRLFARSFPSFPIESPSFLENLVASVDSMVRCKKLTFRDIFSCVAVNKWPNLFETSVSLFIT